MIKCEMKTVTRTVTERALIPGCRAPVGRDSHAAVTTWCVGVGGLRAAAREAEAGRLELRR